MEFQCSPGPVYQTDTLTDGDTASLRRDHSQFGDGYSVRSRSTGSHHSYSQYSKDDPEVDYDEGPTELYRFIENKDWDSALGRLEENPIEAKTWVVRREAKSQKIRWRLLPLHAVCIFRAPLALIEALVEVYPDGAKMKDDQGMLAAHLACRNGASKGVVLTLLKAFPESVSARDRKQRSPADLVENSTSTNKEVVLNAIRKFTRDFETGKIMTKEIPSVPTTVEALSPRKHAANPAEVDYEHRTTLFRLIIKKEWNDVVARAKSHPQEAATFIVTKGFNGNLRFLPIHKACVLQPPEDVVDALLKSYPDGAKASDQDGWLPIHCACFYGAGDKVISSLMAEFPKGSQSKDDEGRLPLHYACLKGASDEMVDLILKAFPKGGMVKDDEGRLPIHHACTKGATEVVIESLLKAAPKGAQSKDEQGRLALHHACRKNASERAIRTLLRVYPRAAQIKDDQDKLPIHYACQNGATPAIVQVLLTTYPESINVKNGFGYTPLAEAKAIGSDKMQPVIKVLEKFKKDHEHLKGDSDENSELREQVAALQEKAGRLEKLLGKVTDLGKDMQKDLRKKDPAEVLERFAGKLADLGGYFGSSKTPLKTRNSTPMRSLFGRGKKSSVKA